MSTAIAATANDRSAYDKLESWSKDNKYPLAARAKDTWETIMDSHSMFFGYGYPPPEWKPGVEPLKLTLADLVQEYHLHPQEAFTRGAIVQYIPSREDIPKVDRMDFLIAVLQEDQDLRVVEVAGRSFAKLANLQIKALALQYFCDWWKEHRQSFVVPATPVTAPAPQAPLLLETPAPIAGSTHAGTPATPVATPTATGTPK